MFLFETHTPGKPHHVLATTHEDVASLRAEAADAGCDMAAIDRMLALLPLACTVEGLAGALRVQISRVRAR